MNLRQILLILRLRWWLVLLVFTLVLAGTATYSLLLPKKYQANTTLLLDVKTDPLLATLMPSLATPGYIATQTEIIQSDASPGASSRCSAWRRTPQPWPSGATTPRAASRSTNTSAT